MPTASTEAEPAPSQRVAVSAPSPRRASGVYLSERQVGGLGPHTILVVYVVLLLLVPSRLVVPGVGATGTLANILLLAGLVWYSVSWLMRRIVPVPFTRLPRLALFGFAIAVLLSYIAAARRDSAPLELSAADRGLIQLLTWVPLVLIATSVRDYAHLDRVLRVFVRCCAVIAVLAIGEFLFKTSLTAWIVIPGLSVNNEVELISRGQFVRPTATAANTLELATVMTMALPFALQQAFHTQGRSLLRRWLPVGLIILAAVMTVSRTSVIGLVVVVLTLMPTWDAKRVWRTFAVLVPTLGMVKLVLPGLGGTVIGLFTAMFEGGDSSTNSRTATSAGVSHYIAERPWTGRGYGTFLPLMYRYTDNQYLLALVEMGVVGVVSIVALYVTTLHCAGAGRRRFTDPARRETGQAFVAVAIVMLIVTVTFDTLSFPMVAGASFMFMGLAGAYLGMARQDQLEKGDPPQ